MTVSEQIIQVIDALCEKFGIAVDWTSQNIIPYIESLGRKLITYEICTSAALIALMLLMSTACIVGTKKLYPVFKKGIKEQDYYEVGWSVSAVLALIATIGIYIATFTVCICQVGDIIKCITFPEMYIFEYVSNLIQ